MFPIQHTALILTNLMAYMVFSYAFRWRILLWNSGLRYSATVAYSFTAYNGMEIDGNYNMYIHIST